MYIYTRLRFICLWKCLACLVINCIASTKEKNFPSVRFGSKGIGVIFCFSYLNFGRETDKAGGCIDGTFGEGRGSEGSSWRGGVIYWGGEKKYCG